MIDLKAAPFNLNDAQIHWVQDTLASMTLEEKAGQVFCPMGFTDNEYVLNHQIRELGIGGLMYRSGPAGYIQQTHRTIQSLAKIPLLLAANTEAGGNGLALEGTSFGAPMAVAATGNPEDAYRMGYTACAEGAAMGLNWSFAPIVDIDKEFHNPITNTRTFGSNVDTVIAREGLYHKGGMMIMVLVSALVDLIMAAAIPNIPIINIAWPTPLFPLVMSWYIFTEVGSVVENAGKMGAPIPEFFVKIMKTGFKKIDEVVSKQTE